MKKILFLFTLCSILFSASAVKAQSPSNYSNYNASQQSPINWLTDYNSAIAQSRSTSKPILILFTGKNWCPPCMKLERNVIEAEPFARFLGNRLVFLRAEFPSNTEKSIQASPYSPLLERYGVNSFPTMVVTDSEGRVLFYVNYQTGGVEAYVKEIGAKLDQFDRSNSNY